MACNPDRKGRCFQYGYVAIDKTINNKKANISNGDIVTLFQNKYA